MRISERNGREAVNVYLDYGRIHRMRTAHGLTQAELAERLNLPASAFSRMLSGHLPIDDADAQRLAKALGCNACLLNRPTPDLLHTRPWLRAYADAPKKTVEQYVADTLLALESFEEVRLKRLPNGCLHSRATSTTTTRSKSSPQRFGRPLTSPLDRLFQTPPEPPSDLDASCCRWTTNLASISACRSSSTASP